MLKKILIACRGEIALRILRTCREMGIATVTVYSEADADAVYLSFADEAVCIGPARASDSYLNMNTLLTVALGCGCDSIHPGYGFLSESPEFAQACLDAGLTFIGPKPETIRLAGNKSQARSTMEQAGIPLVPGSDGPVDTLKKAVETAEKIGYPVLLKASAGGGGKGIRRCNNSEDVRQNFEATRTEALVSFGCADVYLEKLIENPRHIEFQILADRFGNVIHLGDRNCSVQRRNQKLIEEAPSQCLTASMREAMGQAAVQAAKAVGYESCGTVEFLLDSSATHFYFMEMNTRIQVEHGVTELVTGVDLIRSQIRIASGLPLDISQNSVALRGHAIECRINAEDPSRSFLPCPGTVSFVHFPGGNGVRVDSCLYTGYTMQPFYDSMAGKILVHAPSRLEAIRKMRSCLSEFTLEGFPTTAEFCYEILFHPVFVRGNYTTAFLEEHMKELIDFHQKLDDRRDDA